MLFSRWENHIALLSELIKRKKNMKENKKEQQTNNTWF